MEIPEPPRIEGARGILVHVGLGTPVARAFVAATAVGIVAYFANQPAFAFDEEGKMRPFKAVSRAPTATYYHFLGVPLAAAAAAYVFT